MWRGAMLNGPIVALMDAASAKPAIPNSGALTGILTHTLTAVAGTVIHALNAFARKSSLAAVIKIQKNTLNSLKTKQK